MIFEKTLAKLSEREKIGLMVAGISLFLWLVNQVVVLGLEKRLNELGRDIEKKENESRYSKCVLQGMSNITKEYEESSVEMPRAPLSAKTTIMDELMGQVYDLAVQAGISEPATKHHEPVITKYYVEYAVELNGFQAEMPNLVRFLHLAQTAPGMLRVSLLTLSPGKTKSQVTGSILLSKIVMLEEGGAEAGVEAGSETQEAVAPQN